MKPCPEKSVRNPSTGRCIKIGGAIYNKYYKTSRRKSPKKASRGVRRSPRRKSPKKASRGVRRSPRRKSPEKASRGVRRSHRRKSPEKDCPEKSIRNPSTGRCIKIGGTIYKKYFGNDSPKTSRRKSPKKANKKQAGEKIFIGPRACPLKKSTKTIKDYCEYFTGIKYTEAQQDSKFKQLIREVKKTGVPDYFSEMSPQYLETIFELIDKIYLGEELTHYLCQGGHTLYVNTDKACKSGAAGFCGFDGRCSHFISIVPDSFIEMQKN